MLEIPWPYLIDQFDERPTDKQIRALGVMANRPIQGMHELSYIF